jgi:hypothetical protein
MISIETASTTLPSSGPRWLIKHLLETGSRALLYGGPNTGKTFIALDMACRLAIGYEAWGPLEIPRRRGVWYIVPEGPNGFLRRIDAWLRFHEVPLLDRDFNQHFAFTRHAVNVLDAGARRELIDAWRALDRPLPGLIVIDTLATNTGGMDENANQEMGRFSESLRLFQSELAGDHEWPVVLVLHHTAKTPTLDNDGLPQERGGSALRGAFDTMMALIPRKSRDGVAEGGLDPVEIIVTKQRDDAKLDKPILAQLEYLVVNWEDIWDSDSDKYGSLVVSRLEWSGLLKVKEEAEARRAAKKAKTEAEQWEAICENVKGAFIGAQELSLKQIRTAVDLPARSLNRYLSEMVLEGYLTRGKRGVYTLAPALRPAPLQPPLQTAGEAVGSGLAGGADWTSEDQGHA